MFKHIALQQWPRNLELNFGPGVSERVTGKLQVVLLTICSLTASALFFGVAERF